MMTKVRVFGLVAIAGFSITVGQANAAPPAVTNSGASGIGVGTAVLNGLLTAGGSGDAFFCYGSSDGGQNTGNWENVSTSIPVVEGIAFSHAVSNLLYGVEYDYRVYVTNGAGVSRPCRYRSTMARRFGIPYGYFAFVRQD